MLTEGNERPAATGRAWNPPWYGDVLEAAGLDVMGGRGESQGDWRENMHQSAIVVGTVDSLVSKALNRGYGIGRAIYPIDFALATNGDGWHNNHHADPRSAAHGFHRWWELDVTYLSLRLFSLFGLVWDIVPIRRQAKTPSA